jgi:hypothetical protein
VNFRCVAGLLAVGFPAFANSAVLNPETLKAWDEYIQRADSRAQSGHGVGSPFLWVDQDSQQAERVRQGEIVAEPEIGTNGMQAVPRGLIHDWVGAVFIRSVTLAQVFAVLDDYGRYNQFFGPSVIDATLLCRTGQGSGDEDRFRIRYAQKVLFVSEVVDTEYEGRRFQVDNKRWYSITQSTRLQEFRSPGKTGELTGDEMTPFVWRIYCISKFEQRDGGVYMEQENLALSRGIPASLRWLVEPAVRKLSKNLTMSSLRETREAVLSLAQRRTLSAGAVKTGG